MVGLGDKGVWFVCEWWWGGGVTYVYFQEHQTIGIYQNVVLATVS